MKLTRVGAGARRIRRGEALSWIAAQLMPGVVPTCGCSTVGAIPGGDTARGGAWLDGVAAAPRVASGSTGFICSRVLPGGAAPGSSIPRSGSEGRAGHRGWPGAGTPRPSAFSSGRRSSPAWPAEPSAVSRPTGSRWSAMSRELGVRSGRRKAGLTATQWGRERSGTTRA